VRSNSNIALVLALPQRWFVPSLLARQLPMQGLVRGKEAYEVAPPQADTKMPASVAIGVGDELTLTVLGEPDLSAPRLIVDEAGRIQLPLAGSVLVAGLSG
jgi:protein involved in polysaccharide export with SLBB domain